MCFSNNWQPVENSLKKHVVLAGIFHSHFSLIHYLNLDERVDPNNELKTTLPCMNGAQRKREKKSKSVVLP
jgi:hypothetical protein